MKKYSLYELVTLSVIFSLSFFVGCSSEKIAGTSVESNELANRSSSSYFDDSNLGLKSSSSVTSSSSFGDSEYGEKSSSSERPNEGATKPNTLDYYLKMLNVESGAFDKGILSTSIAQNTDGGPHNPNPPMTSEFDTPWPHKIVKQNVDALSEYFPMAVAMYPQIIAAIKNETLDENCGLYTFNVYSDGLSAAYIVSEITENVIKVLDVPAGDCSAIPLSVMSRFLFYYCGELNSHAETEHIVVDAVLSGNCPVLKKGNEWVSNKLPTSSKELIN